MMSNYKTILGIGISIIGLQILTSEASITNPTEERSAKQPEYLAPMESKMTDSIQLDKKIEKASTTNPTEGTSLSLNESAPEPSSRNSVQEEDLQKGARALLRDISDTAGILRYSIFGGSDVGEFFKTVNHFIGYTLYNEYFQKSLSNIENHRDALSHLCNIKLCITNMCDVVCKSQCSFSKLDNNWKLSVYKQGELIAKELFEIVKILDDERITTWFHNGGLADRLPSKIE